MHPQRLLQAVARQRRSRHWQMQSSAKAQESGTEISSAGFSTRRLVPVSGRATVMAGLLENGKYDNVFYGDNLLAVGDPDANGTPFVTPWWYRSEFTLAESAPGSRTLLRINGMIPSADVWLNGHLVADQTVVAGAYPVHEFDVTPWVRRAATFSPCRSIRPNPGETFQ